jgi:hypothetical protein
VVSLGYGLKGVEGRRSKGEVVWFRKESSRLPMPTGKSRYNPLPPYLCESLMRLGEYPLSVF